MGKRSINVLVRLPLRQCGHRQCRGRGQASEPARVIEKTRSMRPQELTTDRAEMLFESPAPNRGNLVARLQPRTPPGRLPAANQAGMPPMFLGQELDNQGALAMSASRQPAPGILPLHQTS